MGQCSELDILENNEKNITDIGDFREESYLGHGEDCWFGK
jgi:hypothetical protein